MSCRTGITASLEAAALKPHWATWVERGFADRGVGTAGHLGGILTEADIRPDRSLAQEPKPRA